MAHTIAHVSDIHFGRIAHPAVVDALVADVNDSAGSLVVASGDLTQRAFPHQYRAARAMLDRFEMPWLVVPGNHDVFPWWRTVSRLYDPLRRYKQWITDDLSPTWSVPGLAVLGINSAFGRTIKGGRIDADQLEAIRSFFPSQPEESFRILVVHHHLTELEALGRHDVAKRAEETLQVADECGVDLILCGHLHISHIDHVQAGAGGRSIVIASAGTATSSRGRSEHRKTNFYNRIYVDSDSFTIEERRFDPASVTFKEARTTRFER